MEKKQEQRNATLAVLVTISVFCMGQIPGSIDAAISKITEYFHLSSTTGLYVTTVASLVSVGFSILLGVAAGKWIGFRPLILFCATVELLGAIFPFWTDNFVVLLILRGLFGVGFGGMQSMENTVAATLIPIEKRASILGMGIFFGFGMNCVLQFLGGVLAERGWNYVFLNHLLLLIPYLIIVIGCVKMDFSTQDTEPADAADENMGKTTWMLPAAQVMTVLFLMGVFIAPLLIGCSFLSAPLDDSATVAGVVAVCFSIGCMVGGILYPKMFAVLARMSLPVFLLLTAMGMIGCGMTRSIVVLCVMIFVSGMGFSATQACAMMVLSLRLPTQKIAFASALMMALFNLGMFLSSSYESVIGAVTGDALYLPLFLGAAVLLVGAVLCAIISPIRR